MYQTQLAQLCQPVDTSRPIYAPRCLAILSQWQFSDFFRDYLTQLVYKTQNGGTRLPFERYGLA